MKGFPVTVYARRKVTVGWPIAMLRVSEDSIRIYSIILPWWRGREVERRDVLLVRMQRNAFGVTCMTVEDQRGEYFDVKIEISTRVRRLLSDLMMFGYPVCAEDRRLRFRMHRLRARWRSHRDQVRPLQGDRQSDISVRSAVRDRYLAAA